MNYKQDIFISTHTYQTILYFSNLFFHCSFRSVMLETVTSRLSFTTLFANLIISCAILFGPLSKGRSFCPYMNNYMIRVAFTNATFVVVIHAIYFLSRKIPDINILLFFFWRFFVIFNPCMNFPYYLLGWTLSSFPLLQTSLIDVHSQGVYCCYYCRRHFS